MKIKLYVAIAILCTSLSGILNASTPTTTPPIPDGSYITGMIFANKTQNPISVTILNIYTTKWTSLIIKANSTTRTSAIQFDINATQVTISDQQNILPQTSFNLSKYSCVNSLKVFQEGVNMYTITSSNNGFSVTPSLGVCSSYNETLQTNPA